MKLSIDRLLISDATLRKRNKRIFSSHADTPQDGFVFASSPESPAANRYRELCSQLFGIETPNKILLVTSSGVAEGKTLTAVNLAFAAAERHKSILLLELSLSRPRFRVVFGAPPHHPGVERVLRGEVQPEEVVGELGNTGISLAGIGDALPMDSELLAPGKHLNTLLDYSRSNFACTILDAPDLTSSSHVTALAQQTEEVLLVARSGKTKTTALQKAIRMLNPQQTSVLMNDFD